jgi:hypothetical protein
LCNKKWKASAGQNDGKYSGFILNVPSEHYTLSVSTVPLRRSWKNLFFIRHSNRQNYWQFHENSEIHIWLFDHFCWKHLSFENYFLLILSSVSHFDHYNR